MHSLLSLALILGAFVAIAFMFGPAPAIAGFIVLAALMTYAYRRGIKLRQRMEDDPAGTWRSIDRTNIAFGKWFAGMAFVTAAFVLVGLIALIVTHA
jgi:ABC-type transport system involved in multi-copper enzyme maturation permease subunit